MTKYNIELEKCENMNSDEIIKTYDLNSNEIKAMKYLYHKQYEKADVIEILSYQLDLNKKEVSKVLGGLKRKGLIYSVIDMPGWIGTEINI